MAEILRQQRPSGGGGTLRRYPSEVVDIDFGAGAAAPIVTLADGRAGRGACLGCRDTPCMVKRLTEERLPGLEHFPGDPSPEVCPTRALRWNEETGAVEVTSACIGCGLCAVRCPYGAIYLEGGSAATVLTGESPTSLETTIPEPQHTHPNPTRKGRLGPSTAPAMAALATVVLELDDARSRLFLRNVLHELGVRCRVRRSGDTNIRIDAAIALESGDIGVVEIERTGAVIESPRALLEDVAVLHGRYGTPLERIRAVSIALILPNRRSEYYRVIDDIHRVLRLRCHTLTVGALLLLLWNFARIDALTDGLFTTGTAGIDLAPSIRAVLGQADTLEGEPYPGALRPAR